MSCQYEALSSCSKIRALGICLGYGGRDIWFSSNSNGSWSAPANAGAPINTAGDEDRFWFSPGSPDLYWNGPGGIMHCFSTGSTCSGTPDAVTIPGCTLPSRVSITDDGQIMYFACRVPETGRIEIMYSVGQDRKSTRLNSSHLVISYAVFCLKKKKSNNE